MNVEDTDLRIEQILAEVHSTTKYGSISSELVRHIAQRELRNRRTLKEAEKATRATLHQIATAYLNSPPRYATWLTQLAQSRDLRRTCAEIMRQHASTAERLGILDTFYTTIFEHTGPVHSILDLACGLHPLAIPWMPLEPDATYYACDIFNDMVTFLNSFFELAGVTGTAQVCDLVQAPPQQPADVAFVLKALPVLEHIEKDAGLNLLRSLRVNYAVVSFPVHSLGGKSKGMLEQYTARFDRLIAREGWQANMISFATEVVYIVTLDRKVSM